MAPWRPLRIDAVPGPHRCVSCGRDPRVHLLREKRFCEVDGLQRTRALPGYTRLAMSSPAMTKERHRGAERRSGAEPSAESPSVNAHPSLPVGRARHTLEPDPREMPERRRRAALAHAHAAVAVGPLPQPLPAEFRPPAEAACDRREALLE